MIGRRFRQPKMLKICMKLLVKQWKKNKQSFPKPDQSDTQQLFFRFLFEWKAAAPLIKLLSMFLYLLFSAEILICVVTTGAGVSLL